MAKVFKTIGKFFMRLFNLELVEIEQPDKIEPMEFGLDDLREVVSPLELNAMTYGIVSAVIRKFGGKNTVKADLTNRIIRIRNLFAERAYEITLIDEEIVKARKRQENLRQANVEADLAINELERFETVITS